MSQDPSLLKQLAESVAPETLGIFMRVMLQVMSVGSELNRLTSLPAERKIALGKQLKSVAKELTNLETKFGEVTSN